MIYQSVSKPRKAYKFPSLTPLGTVESKTAGPGEAAADGAPGYHRTEARRDIRSAEVTIPRRSRK